MRVLAVKNIKPQRREGHKGRNAKTGAFFICRVAANEKASLTKTVTRFLSKYTLPFLGVLSVLSESASGRLTFFLNT